MGFCTINGVDVNCEVTQKLEPMVPMDLRELIMQAFHGVGYPAAERDHKMNKQIRRLRPLVRPAVMRSFMDPRYGLLRSATSDNGNSIARLW